MPARIILAATAVAALTAFVRADSPPAEVPGTTPVVAVQPKLAPATSAAKAHLSAAAPTSGKGKPVRVVLAPLYASADTVEVPRESESSFIPTPGSPLGKHGAALALALPQAKSLQVATPADDVEPAPPRKVRVATKPATPHRRPPVALPRPALPHSPLPLPVLPVVLQ